MGRKKKKPVKPWCWYCNREFEDEKILIQHQKAKHFKCHICFKKLYTGPGLAIHCMQVHKVTLEKVPNSLPHRSNIDVEIYGMEGIPEDDVKEHERQRHGPYKEAEISDDEHSQDATEVESARSAMPRMPSMPGMMQGMPGMHGMMPGMHFPPMPGGPPMGPMGPMGMGLPPGFMPPVGSMPNFGGMPGASNMPPSTAAGTVQAPPKPLFPAAVAQTSTSSTQAPVGTDFKPLTTAPPTKPTFPAYSGNSSPNISGQPLKPLGTSPAIQNLEASTSPQINAEPKRPAIQTTTASSKIVHPNEDISMEEKRSLMYKYRGQTNISNIPPMMNGMPMLRPNMGMPPAMSNQPMQRMGSPYSGQTMYQMMGGQGGSRPF